MSTPLPAINSDDSWSPLEEVWLGDVYPPEWYDHLEPRVRDVFCRLTDITREDLSYIERTLKSHGIQVCRPEYRNIEDWLDHQDQLHKPCITPRDYFVVIGNQLIGHEWQFSGWESVIDQYQQDNRCQVVFSQDHCINGANVVRVGHDIIVDRDNTQYQYNNEWPDRRVQVVENGGHMDGCFAVLRPGLLMANHYWDQYAETFPGWDIIMLDNPTYSAAPSRGYAQNYPVYNGRFWDTGVGTNRSFNQHVIDHALDWVGCYTETYFELNCLSIDEHHVVMLGYNAGIEAELRSRGIEVIWVPFRARSFWDGAMHCLTVDIRRRSRPNNYFS